MPNIYYRVDTQGTKKYKLHHIATLHNFFAWNPHILAGWSKF